MGIGPWTSVRTAGNQAVSRMTGARDHGSLELPGGLLLQGEGEIVPKNEAKDKQDQKTAGDTERGKERRCEGEKGVRKRS